MGDFKRVLTAIGFTPYSEGILNYAATVAAKLGAAELIVASIINSRDVDAVSKISALGYDVNGEHYVSGIQAERRDLMDGYLKQISFPAEKIRLVFAVGNPVDELLKITVREQIDLIVMGVKGRSDLEYVLVGSVAEKMFRRSPVPILSYRSKEHAERLRKNIHTD